MPYTIHEIELSQPLAPIQVPEGDTGFALVVRDRGRPVGLVMRPGRGGDVIGSDELATLIAREAGLGLLTRRIHRELVRQEEHRLPSLTIAICTRDRPALTARCLDSIRSLDRAGFAMGELEVLVVDNAPSDDRTRRAAAQAGVRYVVERLPGLDFARNCALEHARGELIAFLDDDVVVDRGWLRGLATACGMDPGAGAITGLVLPYELRTPAQILFEARGGFRRGFVQRRYRGQVRPNHPYFPVGAGIFGAGCNMVFRRRLLRELGGFDEALDTGPPLPGGGDLDAFYRVMRSGASLVYEPSMLVFHQHRERLDQLRRQYYTWGLGFAAFLQKTYGSDPERRRDVRALLRWWLADLSRAVKNAMLRRHPLPLDMMSAELAGAFAGLTGTYARSARRTRRLREGAPA